MPFIKLQSFSGIVPKLGPTNLNDSQAQVANNVKLQSGELRAWRNAVFEYSPIATGVKSIFKFSGPTGSNPIWLESTQNTDIVVGPVADTSEYRLYYTSDTFPPRKTNWLLATGNGGGSAPYPNAYYEMGVPAPTGAPTLNPVQSITTINLINGGDGYTSLPAVSFSGGGGTGVAAAALISAVVSSINITNGGSGYTAPPTVSFESTSIGSISVSSPGAGYTSAPTVTFTGGDGTGVAASAVLATDGTGTISEIVLTNAGTGYTVAPSVVLSGGGGTGAAAVASSGGGAGALATAVISGSINTITINSGGTGFTSAPNISFIGGGGAGATATASITGGSVSSITITNAGTGYTSAPTIIFNSTSGVGAIATATISATVSKVNVTFGGGGYLAVPTVSFTSSDGNGSGAAATAGINGSVRSITVTNNGSGYGTVPIVNITGGGGSGASAEAVFDTVETRSYIYTHVTEFGTVAEESAPSPAATCICSYAGADVTVSGFSTPTAGNYNFKYRRIYRSVTGNNSTTYQLVAEIPIANSSYVDSVKATDLGLVLPSLYYTPPPNDLQGIISMPNGMLAGFTGNQIWFCEPYIPHAWPSTYMLTTEYPIVGLGVFNNSLFVGTTKNPYIITGSDPSQMSQEKLAIAQPCVSKKSIVSDQFGVMYASPNGLVSIGPGIQDVVTTALFSRDEWQAINPSSMIGALYNNMYFGFYKVGAAYNAIVIQRNDNPPLVNFNSPANAVFVEPGTGYLFALSNVDNKIYRIDGSDTSSTYDWKSKVFQSPLPTNFGVLQVHADYTYMAANSGSYINVKIYADGVKKYEGNIVSQDPIRLPAGYKAYNWEVEVVGNVPVRTVVIASTMSEIKAV